MNDKNLNNLQLCRKELLFFPIQQCQVGNNF